MSLSDARAFDDAMSRLPLRAAAPKPGPDARTVRRRMAEVITQHLTSSGNVTKGDLERAGFSADEVGAHFAAAARRAGANRIAA